MPAADFESIKKEVKAIVAEIAEMGVGEISDEALFAEDLGIDSMMALEIAATIEKKYKVVIPEEQIPSIKSLKNIYELLEKLINKK